MPIVRQHGAGLLPRLAREAGQADAAIRGQEMDLQLLQGIMQRRQEQRAQERQMDFSRENREDQQAFALQQAAAKRMGGSPTARRGPNRARVVGASDESRALTETIEPFRDQLPDPVFKALEAGARGGQFDAKDLFDRAVELVGQQQEEEDRQVPEGMIAAEAPQPADRGQGRITGPSGTFQIGDQGKVQRGGQPVTPPSPGQQQQRGQGVFPAQQPEQEFINPSMEALRQFQGQIPDRTFRALQQQAQADPGNVNALVNQIEDALPEPADTGPTRAQQQFQDAAVKAETEALHVQQVVASGNPSVIVNAAVEAGLLPSEGVNPASPFPEDVQQAAEALRSRRDALQSTATQIRQHVQRLRGPQSRQRQQGGRQTAAFYNERAAPQTGPPQGVSAPATQAAPQGSGPRFRAPGGETVTSGEIEETAREEGVSPQQVIQDLQLQQVQ